MVEYMLVERGGQIKVFILQLISMMMSVSVIPARAKDGWAMMSTRRNCALYYYQATTLSISSHRMYDQVL